jgi:hypothetical protein
MPSWNPGQSFIISTGGGGGQPLTPEWQSWIAENLLLGNTPPSLVEAMVRDGFERDTATREVEATRQHPILQAALAVLVAKTSTPVRQEEQRPRSAPPQPAPGEGEAQLPFEIEIYQLPGDETLKKHRSDGTGWDWGWAERRRQWMDDSPSHHAYRCLPLTILNQTGFWIRNPVGFSAVWNGRPEPGTVKFTFDTAGDFWSNWINTQFGLGIITWNTPFLFRTKPIGSRLLVTGPVNYFKENLCALNALIESYWISMSFTMNWRVLRPNEPIRFDLGEPLFQAIPLASNVCADIERAEVTYCRLGDNAEVAQSYMEWQQSRNQFHQQKAKGAVRPDGWQKDYFHGQDAAGRDAAPDHRTKVTPPPIHFTHGTSGNAPEGLA